MSASENRNKSVRICLQYETANGELLSCDEYPDVITVNAEEHEYTTHNNVCKAVDNELALRGLDRGSFVVIWRVINPPFSHTVH